ncbi:hypothetical protein TWF281_002973 [Arthrobotrys megalospora]
MTNTPNMLGGGTQTPQDPQQMHHTGLVGPRRHETRTEDAPTTALTLQHIQQVPTEYNYAMSRWASDGFEEELQGSPGGCDRAARIFQEIQAFESRFNTEK